MSSTKSNYTAYQLNFYSELALPEFLSVPAGGDLTPDVRILLGDVSESGIPGGAQVGPFLWCSADCLWLRVPYIARFLVTGGSTITITPEAGADEDSIRVFLLGSALGALLSQRGYLVLHGNAIRIGDQCMVCVGPSGCGKSTLAAGFLQRGYDVLADDVVAVNSDCQVVPGFPRIKLWRDVADKLAIDVSALRRIRPSMEKYNLPLQYNYAAEPLPVRWMYILGSDHIDNVRVEPIVGLEKFKPLYDNTYRVRFLNGMGLEQTHLQHCGRLAGNLHLARIDRPKIEFIINELIDQLLLDCRENP